MGKKHRRRASTEGAWFTHPGPISEPQKAKQAGWSDIAAAGALVLMLTVSGGLDWIGQPLPPISAPMTLDSEWLPPEPEAKQPPQKEVPRKQQRRIRDRAAR